MSERDEIQARVAGFRRMQERLCAERNARMDQTTQQIRQTLADMHAIDVRVLNEDRTVQKFYWPIR